MVFGQEKAVESAGLNAFTATVALLNIKERHSDCHIKALFLRETKQNGCIRGIYISVNYNATRIPISAREAAILTATVVFPTPPLPPVTPMTGVENGLR